MNTTLSRPPESPLARAVRHPALRWSVLALVVLGSFLACKRAPSGSQTLDVAPRDQDIEALRGTINALPPERREALNAYIDGFYRAVHHEWSEFHQIGLAHGACLSSCGIDPRPLAEDCLNACKADPTARFNDTVGPDIMLKPFEAAVAGNAGPITRIASACAVMCNLRIGQDGVGKVAAAPAPAPAPTGASAPKPRRSLKEAAGLGGGVAIVASSIACGKCCADAASGLAADLYHPMFDPDLGYAGRTGIAINPALAAVNPGLPSLAKFAETGTGNLFELAAVSDIPTVCNLRLTTGTVKSVPRP
jgi:hypothetical protein